MTYLALGTGKWFYTHGFETMLIIGICFTGIGFLFGYQLWKHYQSNIRRIQATNAKLRDKITLLEAHQEKVAEHIEANAPATPSSDH